MRSSLSSIRFDSRPSMSATKMMRCTGWAQSAPHSLVSVIVPVREITTIVTSTPTKTKKNLTMKTLNPNLIKLQYAVRGPLVVRAAEIEKELMKVNKLFVTNMTA